MIEEFAANRIRVLAGRFHLEERPHFGGDALMCDGRQILLVALADCVA